MSKKDKDFPIIIASETAVCHGGRLNRPASLVVGYTSGAWFTKQSSRRGMHRVVLLCTPLHCGHFCVLLSVPHEHDFPGDVVPPQASWPWSAAAGGRCTCVSLFARLLVSCWERDTGCGGRIYTTDAVGHDTWGLTSLPLQGQWKGDVGTPQFCLVSWLTPSVALPECRIFQ